MQAELSRPQVDVLALQGFRANIVRNLDEFHAAFATRDGDGLWVPPGDRVRIW